MVKSATGVAESPSMRTICASGAGSSRSTAAKTAPTTIAQGSGLVSAPRNDSSAAAMPERAASPSPAVAVLAGLGERQAQRAGEDQVDEDRADHRPRGGFADQRHQQRHAHEAGVRERGDERAERRVLEVDACRMGSRAGASRRW